MRVNSVKDLGIAKGDKVFVRCDFNVPMDEFGNITDDRRIREALPTIKYLLDTEAKIVLASHMGRPKGEFNEKYSLSPVAKRLSHLLHEEVILAIDYDKCVSSDFTSSLYSSIVAIDLTQVIDGNMVKVMAWYDNEMGYSNRLVDMAVIAGEYK